MSPKRQPLGVLVEEVSDDGKPTPGETSLAPNREAKDPTSRLAQLEKELCIALYALRKGKFSGAFDMPEMTKLEVEELIVSALATLHDYERDMRNAEESGKRDFYAAALDSVASIVQHVNAVMQKMAPVMAQHAVDVLGYQAARKVMHAREMLELAVDTAVVMGLDPKALFGMPVASFDDKNAAAMYHVMPERRKEAAKAIAVRAMRELARFYLSGEDAESFIEKTSREEEKGDSSTSAILVVIRVFAQNIAQKAEAGKKGAFFVEHNDDPALIRAHAAVLECAQATLGQSGDGKVTTYTRNEIVRMVQRYAPVIASLLVVAITIFAAIRAFSVEADAAVITQTFGQEQTEINTRFTPENMNRSLSLDYVRSSGLFRVDPNAETAGGVSQGTDGGGDADLPFVEGASRDLYKLKMGPKQFTEDQVNWIRDYALRNNMDPKRRINEFRTIKALLYALKTRPNLNPLFMPQMHANLEFIKNKPKELSGKSVKALEVRRLIMEKGGADTIGDIVQASTAMSNNMDLPHAFLRSVYGRMRDFWEGNLDPEQPLLQDNEFTKMIDSSGGFSEEDRKAFLLDRPTIEEKLQVAPVRDLKWAVLNRLSTALMVFEYGSDVVPDTLERFRVPGVDLPANMGTSKDILYYRTFFTFAVESTYDLLLARKKALSITDDNNISFKNYFDYESELLRLVDADKDTAKFLGQIGDVILNQKSVDSAAITANIQVSNLEVARSMLSYIRFWKTLVLRWKPIDAFSDFTDDVFGASMMRIASIAIFASAGAQAGNIMARYLPRSIAQQRSAPLHLLVSAPFWIPTMGPVISISYSLLTTGTFGKAVVFAGRITFDYQMLGEYSGSLVGFALAYEAMLYLQDRLEEQQRDRAISGRKSHAIRRKTSAIPMLRDKEQGSSIERMTSLVKNAFYSVPRAIKSTTDGISKPRASRPSSSSRGRGPSNPILLPPIEPLPKPSGRGIRRREKPQSSKTPSTTPDGLVVWRDNTPDKSKMF